MQPETLDQSITIQAEGTIPDGYGGTIPGGWADVATELADVEPLEGEEVIANMRVTAKQTYRFWLNAGVSVATTNRIVWAGRALNVRQAPEPGSDTYRQVVAEDLNA